MKTPVFVSGLGRCGTSLVMQMIAASGFPVFGEFPAFEPDEVNFINRDVGALLSRKDAMKILDPHRDISWPSRFNARIIWIDRNNTEQAKSQAKFLRCVGGIDVPGQAWRSIRGALREDRRTCEDWLNACSNSPLTLRFEDLLSHPLSQAKAIAEFLDIGPCVLGDMASAVLKRNPQCRKDMSIEMSLIQAQTVAEKFGVSIPMAAARLLSVCK